MSFIVRHAVHRTSTCFGHSGISCMLPFDQGIRNALRLVSTARVAYSTDIGDDVSPQGVQGDDCSHFRLWQENCTRYGLTNCNEQLQGIQSGRKTLAEVLAEQDKLIADIAREYRAAQHYDGRQGVQDNSADFPEINAPCPQGIQGDDCVRFKLWLENCHRFGVEDCMQQYSSFKAGRKTLAEIFAEQDRMIRDAAKMVLQQQRRNYSTSASGDGHKNKTSVAPPDGGSSVKAEEIQRADGVSSSAETEEVPEAQLTQRQKLQRAVKEYGSTVIVFHVTISLASLGFFYLLVSSGLDVAGFLLRLDIGGEMLKSKLAAGTGTFVLAYAVHKVFAPVRIATTLTATPFIVRYLRRVGFLKVPSAAKPKK